MTAQPELSGVERQPLPPGLVAACERAVDAAGGDADDLADLLAVHRRALARAEQRAAVIRLQVTRRRCACADGGDDGEGDRCGRCWGVRR